MTSLELISRLPDKKQYETPILFIHGAWHSVWCWDKYFLPYFAKNGFEVHALSLRGHGQSNGRLFGTSVKHYVTDVAEIANQLPQRPIVIGHSLGGFITQKYLETYHAPAGILMASAPPKGVFRTSISYLRRHPLAFLKTNVTLNLGPIIGTPALAREMLFSPDMPESNFSEYFAQLQDESYLAYLDMMFLNLPKPARVKTPILVLGAEHDRVFTMKEVEETAVAYQTTPHFFPMAHDMMLEKGWQQVADKIINWLQSNFS
ncbi:MAG: alpha/beta hydrolase [Chloroflexi bacterium]|nr:alpha/beta hydrolase [Chloroflexota bacterium]